MMTALSCLAIGLAFLLAVGLLVVAGFFLGWVLPERWRRAREERQRAEGDP